MREKEFKEILKEAENNMQRMFFDNPHRGIAAGIDAFGNQIQLSWIMGRSENSQNRVYTTKSRKMFTEAADPSKVEDPSLIIYNSMDYHKNERDNAIVTETIASNGAQTDTVFKQLKDPVVKNPKQALSYMSEEHYCEPDEPIFTPRITALQFSSEEEFNNAYFLAQVADPDAKELWKKVKQETDIGPDNFLEQTGGDKKVAKELYLSTMEELTGYDAFKFLTHSILSVKEVQEGIGFCLTTYAPGDSKNLPSSNGIPFMIPMNDNLEGVMQKVWNELDPRFKVSLGGREVDKETGNIRYAKPINKNSKVNYQKK